MTFYMFTLHLNCRVGSFRVPLIFVSLPNEMMGSNDDHIEQVLVRLIDSNCNLIHCAVITME